MLSLRDGRHPCSEGSSDQHPPTTHPASTLKPTPHPKASSPSADRIMCTQVRNDVPDHDAFRYVPFTGETYGRPTNETIRFMNRLAVIDAELGQLRLVTVRERGMLRCAAGVGCSSPVSRVCVMILVLQCQG